jgi:hypothetical protein
MSRPLSGRRPSAARACPPLDPLEPRVLLSAADLAATVNDAKTLLPPTAVSGDGKKITLAIALANQGDAAVPVGQKISVAVVAVRTSDDARTPLQTFANVSVSGLKAGATLPLKFTTTLPAGLADGAYRLELTADSADALPESDESNNTAQTAAEIAVTRGAVSLTDAVASSAFPASAIAGQKAAGSVKVTLTNDGNIATPAGAKVSVSLVLRPDGGGDDVLIGTKLNQAFANVKPGAKVTVAISAALTATLPAGGYTLVAHIAPTGFTPDAAADAVGASFAVVDPFVQLVVTAATDPFAAAAGGNTAGNAVVTLANHGNVAAVGPATVTYWATTDGTITESSLNLGSQNLTLKLAPGAALKTPAFAVALPNPDSTTAYTLVAAVTSPSLAVGDVGGFIPAGTVSVSHLSHVWFHGDTITFKATSTLNLPPVFVQSGTFTTNLGVTGTYTLTTGDLRLMYDTGPGEDYVFAFTGSPVSFSGKKVIFSFDPARAVGSLPNRGDNNDQTAYARFA